MSPVVFVTVTDFTTVKAPTASASPSTIGSTLAISSTASLSSPASTSTSPSRSQTSIPALPSGWSTPTPTPSPSLLGEHAPNNTVANLILAGVITLGLLYIGFFTMIILSWIRKRCLKCTSLENKIKFLEEGGSQKRITKEMVRAREKSVRESRAAALADLEGQTQGVNDEKKTLWSMVFGGKEKGKGKERAISPVAPNPTTHVEDETDRYFTVDTPRTPSPPNLPPTTSYSYPQQPTQPSRVFRSASAEEMDEAERGYRDTQGKFHSYGEDYPGGDRSAAYNPKWHDSTAYAKAMDMHYNNEVYMRAYSDERREAAAGPAEAPKPMERISSDDPDAQLYRTIAARAAEKTNPNAEADKRYAEKLLQDIRDRQTAKVGSRYGYPSLSSPGQLEDVSIGGAPVQSEKKPDEPAWKTRAREMMGLKK